MFKFNKNNYYELFVPTSPPPNLCDYALQVFISNSEASRYFPATWYQNYLKPASDNEFDILNFNEIKEIYETITGLSTTSNDVNKNMWASYSGRIFEFISTQYFENKRVTQIDNNRNYTNSVNAFVPHSEEEEDDDSEGDGCDKFRYVNYAIVNNSGNPGCKYKDGVSRGGSSDADSCSILNLAISENFVFFKEFYNCFKYLLESLNDPADYNESDFNNLYLLKHDGEKENRGGQLLTPSNKNFELNKNEITHDLKSINIIFSKKLADLKTKVELYITNYNGITELRNKINTTLYDEYIFNTNLDESVYNLHFRLLNSAWNKILDLFPNNTESETLKFNNININVRQLEINKHQFESWEDYIKPLKEHYHSSLNLFLLATNFFPGDDVNYIDNHTQHDWIKNIDYTVLESLIVEKNNQVEIDGEVVIINEYETILNNNSIGKDTNLFSDYIKINKINYELYEISELSEFYEDTDISRVNIIDDLINYFTNYNTTLKTINENFKNEAFELNFFRNKIKTSGEYKSIKNYLIQINSNNELLKSDYDSLYNTSDKFLNKLNSKIKKFGETVININYIKDYSLLKFKLLHVGKLLKKIKDDFEIMLREADMGYIKTVIFKQSEEFNRLLKYYKDAIDNPVFPPETQLPNYDFDIEGTLSQNIEKVEELRKEVLLQLQTYEKTSYPEEIEIYKHIKKVFKKKNFNYSGFEIINAINRLETYEREMISLTDGSKNNIVNEINSKSDEIYFENFNFNYTDINTRILFMKNSVDDSDIRNSDEPVIEQFEADYSDYTLLLDKCIELNNISQIVFDDFKTNINRKFEPLEEIKENYLMLTWQSCVGTFNPALDISQLPHYNGSDCDIPIKSEIEEKFSNLDTNKTNILNFVTRVADYVFNKLKDEIKTILTEDDHDLNVLLNELIQNIESEIETHDKGIEATEVAIEKINIVNTLKKYLVGEATPDLNTYRERKYTVEAVLIILNDEAYNNLFSNPNKDMIVGFNKQILDANTKIEVIQKKINDEIDDLNEEIKSHIDDATKIAKAYEAVIINDYRQIKGHKENIYSIINNLRDLYSQFNTALTNNNTSELEELMEEIKEEIDNLKEEHKNLIALKLDIKVKLDVIEIYENIEDNPLELEIEELITIRLGFSELELDIELLDDLIEEEIIENNLNNEVVEDLKLILDAESSKNIVIARQAVNKTKKLIIEENKNIVRLFKLIREKGRDILTLLGLPSFLIQIERFINNYKTNEYFNYKKAEDIMRNIDQYVLELSVNYKSMSILSIKINELSNLFDNQFDPDVNYIEDMIKEHKVEYSEILRIVSDLKEKIKNYKEANKLDNYDVYSLYQGPPVNYTFMIIMLIVNVLLLSIAIFLMFKR
jgi:hypothetical protein